LVFSPYTFDFLPNQLPNPLTQYLNSYNLLDYYRYRIGITSEKTKKSDQILLGQTKNIFLTNFPNNMSNIRSGRDAKYQMSNTKSIIYTESWQICKCKDA